MTIINHWGKWVDSDIPVTGVLSINSIDFSMLDLNDEICITCEEIREEIENYEDEEMEDEDDFIECDSSHTRLMGDWLKDDKGLYYPNPEGEFAAIERESTIQVVFSIHITKGSLCSPCYPGQVDLDSEGEYLAYTLPSHMLYKEEV